MSYNSNSDSGMAETKSWVQVPCSVFDDIDQGIELEDKNYAMMVHQINSTPLTVEGDLTVAVDTVGIDDSGDVGITNGKLNVIDDINYSTRIEVETNETQIITYVMSAKFETTNLLSEAVWRISRTIEDDTGLETAWADGNDLFDNIAENYNTTVVYSL